MLWSILLLHLSLSFSFHVCSVNPVALLPNTLSFDFSHDFEWCCPHSFPVLISSILYFWLVGLPTSWSCLDIVWGSDFDLPLRIADSLWCWIDLDFIARRHLCGESPIKFISVSRWPCFSSLPATSLSFRWCQWLLEACCAPPRLTRVSPATRGTPCLGFKDFNFARWWYPHFWSSHCDTSLTPREVHWRCWSDYFFSFKVIEF